MQAADIYQPDISYICIAVPDKYRKFICLPCADIVFYKAEPFLCIFFCIGHRDTIGGGLYLRLGCDVYKIVDIAFFVASYQKALRFKYKMLHSLLNYGNTAGRQPCGLAPHLLRPKEVPLGYSFSVILHKTCLITVRSSARFAHSDDRQAAGANVVLKRYYLSE